MGIFLYGYFFFLTHFEVVKNINSFNYSYIPTTEFNSVKRVERVLWKIQVGPSRVFSVQADLNIHEVDTENLINFPLHS